MDSGRLPAYRSSYMLRFHPYPRTKLSTREIVASARDPADREPFLMDILYAENDVPFTLNQALHETSAHRGSQLRQRRLSMSSLVVDLALVFTDRQPLQKN